ncbi:alpha/beta hydrolase [Candidatus Woesearchaeota archaeon]|nr:alpha/beta hydrolase [Candidatus Woesearchaeota archaeon]
MKSFKDRLFSKKKNIAFLKSYLKETHEELDVLLNLERDYQDKVKYISNFEKDWKNATHLKELRKLMKKVRNLVVFENGKEVRLLANAKRIVAEIEKILQDESLTEDEKQKLGAIGDRIASEYKFFGDLALILELQRAHFEQNKKGDLWQENQEFGKFKDLVYREGQYLGQQKALQHQIINDRQMTEDTVRFESSAKALFSDIKTEDIRLGPVAGILYYKDLKNAKGGVAATHGFFGYKGNSDLLYRRIADYGYPVYAFDLPGHQDSEGQLEFGLASEYFLRATAYLHGIGINKVAALGHSTGAASSLFALYNYNSIIEKKIYEKLEEFASVLSSDKPNFEDMATELYKEIIGLILQELRTSRFGGAKIDAIIMLAPPLTIQAVVSPGLLKFVANRPKLINMLWGKKWLRLDNVKALADYLCTVKNPPDFLDLIDFFSDGMNKIDMNDYMDKSRQAFEVRNYSKSELDHAQSVKGMKNRFIHQYKQRVVSGVPKLLLKGTRDIVARTFSKKGKKSYEDTYMKHGNVEFHWMPRFSHWFNDPSMKIDLKNKTGLNWAIDATDAIVSAKPTKLILEFLDKHLNNGVLPK